MISRRVISAPRVAQPLPRPVFIRAFSEQKESLTQPFNHSEEKMKGAAAVTEKGVSVFTMGFFGCVLGGGATIYVGNLLFLWFRHLLPQTASTVTTVPHPLTRFLQVSLRWMCSQMLSWLLM
jgi:hypothetical protein